MNINLKIFLVLFVMVAITQAVCDETNCLSCTSAGACGWCYRDAACHVWGSWYNPCSTEETVHTPYTCPNNPFLEFNGRNNSTNSTNSTNLRWN